MQKKELKKGLVSIGFPTYNRSRFLRGAIGALLSQTYPTTEIIISDNASSDNTKNICEEFARKDPRIRYIRQKENIGQLANYRFVALQAQGEYFMIAADDDKYVPSYIVTLKSALDVHPECGVAISSYRRSYDDGTPIDEFRFEGKEDLGPLDHYELFYRSIVPGRKFSYITTFGLFRTALLQKFLSRPYPDCIRYDRVFIGEFSLGVRVVSVPQVLFEKIMYRKGIAERYTADPIGKTYRRKKYLRHFRYLWQVFFRVATSCGIPWQRKVRALILTFPRIAKDMIPFILIYDFPRVYRGLKRYG